MESLFSLASSNLVQIGIILLILIIAWFVVSAIIRLTIRIIAFGCGTILVIGLALFVLRTFFH